MRKIAIGILFLIIFSQPSWGDLGITNYSFFRMMSPATAPVAGDQLGLVQILVEIYSQTVVQQGTLGIIQNSATLIKPEVTEKSYVFPNPFRFSQGANIGYTLSKSLDIEIRIYDVLAHLVYKENFQAGVEEGAIGSPHYNKVPINVTTIGHDLSSGVYFYYILNDKTVLDKGKMMVMP